MSSDPSGVGKRRYDRRRSKDIHTATGGPTSAARRFWPKVSIPNQQPGTCWVWTASVNKHGYGQLDRIGAHRVSYWLATGVDPGPQQVMHACDNPPCVRPSHLSLGSHADNMADKAAKGRAITKAKLTREQVDEMRRLYGTGRWSVTALADRYDIVLAQAARIVRGESWKPRPGEILPTPDWKQQGRTNPQQRLTNEQVHEIRARYAMGGISQRALATEYGVGQPHICHIINGTEREAA